MTGITDRVRELCSGHPMERDSVFQHGLFLAAGRGFCAEPKDAIVFAEAYCQAIRDRATQRQALDIGTNNAILAQKRRKRAENDARRQAPRQRPEQVT